MQEVTNRLMADLAVTEIERGWRKSKNGNYWLMVDDGNLSVVCRDGRWSWNMYRSDKPVFPRFQGDFPMPLAAMMAATNWYTQQ